MDRMVASTKHHVAFWLQKVGMNFQGVAEVGCGWRTWALHQACPGTRSFFSKSFFFFFQLRPVQSVFPGKCYSGFWIPSRGWFQVLFLYMTERSYFWQTRPSQCQNLAMFSLVPKTVTQGGLRCGLRNTLSVVKLQQACENYIVQETVYGLVKDSYWCWPEVSLRCGHLETAPG